MAWATPRDWVAGETITAAKLNTLRDQMNETGPATATAAGDLLVADGANSLKRLALGTASYFLKVNAGGTDIEWSVS